MANELLRLARRHLASVERGDSGENGEKSGTPGDLSPLSPLSPPPAVASSAKAKDPELARALELGEQVEAAFDRLRELTLKLGEKHGWPGLQLAPWCWQYGGESGWQKVLLSPAVTLGQVLEILRALQRRLEKTP